MACTLLLHRQEEWASVCFAMTSHEKALAFMHVRYRMQSGRRHSALLLALLLSLVCAFPLQLHAEAARLSRVRLAVHPKFTRLVFDAQGQRPLAVGPASEEGIQVIFPQLAQDALPGRNLNLSRSMLSGIDLRQTDSGTVIAISFRNKGTTVKHQVTASRPPASERYRLILDFYPPGAPEAVDRKPVDDKSTGEPGTAQKPTPKAEKETDLLKDYLQPPPATALKGAAPESSQDPKGKKSRASSAEASQSAKSRNKTDGGLPVQPAQPQEPPTPDPEAAAALYDQADAFFAEHEKDLVQNAPEVIARYIAALNAAPRSARAPVAYYRCGLSYFAVANITKAERSFREVLSSWPESPIAAKCWLGLGRIHIKRNSHIEAIEAFRAALKIPMDKSDVALTHYLLGVTFHSAGIYKEAEEMLNQAATEDPLLFIREPSVFKTSGEVYFALQKYDKSRDYLLRYLNIQPDSMGRDLILARIAETFLYEGDRSTANRLYNYLRRDFPDSEGGIISSIRQAELMEKQDGRVSGAAQAIYEELAQKNVPPTLRNLVSLKIAAWEYKRENYDKSMEAIDQIMRGRPDSSTYSEAITLRDLVLVGWLKRAFSGNNQALVAQIYEKYLPLFKAMQSPELDLMAADSYATLKFYPAALEIYENILSTSKKKNEDLLLKAAQSSLFVGDLDKAVQYCKQIQSEAFENPKSEILGGIYYRQGKYADAAKSYSKVFQKDKEYLESPFDSLFSYVKSLVELKKYEDALMVIQKSTPRMEKESGEDRLHICLLTSKCQQEIKQTQQAIESLEGALALTSDEEKVNLINYEISRLYMALGQTDKASEKLNAILGTSVSFWKTAAQQQLDSIQMSRQQQGEPESTKQ